MKKKIKKVKRSYIRRSEELKKEVVNYYHTSGESLRKVAEKYSIPVPTIASWCAKFAKGTTSQVVDEVTMLREQFPTPFAAEQTDTMDNNKKKNPEQEKRLRLIKGITEDNIDKASQEQLVALLKELKYAKEELKIAQEEADFQRVNADIHKKAIEITEKNLNISILKKVGTKR